MSPPSNKVLRQTQYNQHHRSHPNKKMTPSVTSSSGGSSSNNSNGDFTIDKDVRQRILNNMMSEDDDDKNNRYCSYGDDEDEDVRDANVVSDDNNSDEYNNEKYHYTSNDNNDYDDNDSDYSSFVLDEESINPDIVSVALYDSPSGKQEQKKKIGIKETLFGDTRTNKGPIDIGSNPKAYIKKRTLQPWSVYENTSTQPHNTWTICNPDLGINTYTHLSSKKEATHMALSNTPPIMENFDVNPKCYICTSKFAVFRRPSHCRNCGICICNTCSVKVSCKILPSSYNIKDTNTLSICIGCDWLHREFMHALITGQYDNVITLYNTYGNINLRNPFKLLYNSSVCNNNSNSSDGHRHQGNTNSNSNNEMVYPIHCAIIGGNINIIKWLVDEMSVPLTSYNSRKEQYVPIKTSKGRTALSIALSNGNVDIIRYLVADQNMSFFQEGKNLHLHTILHNFTRTLQILPPSSCSSNNNNNEVQDVRTRRRKVQEGVEVPTFIEIGNDNNNVDDEITYQYQ